MPERIRIGDLAKRAGVTTRTVKYYEELGLLEPAGKTKGGFRVFNEEDVAAVEAICRMRAVGLSLHTIKEVLALRRTVSGLDNTPISTRKLVQLIARLEHRLLHVDDNVKRLEEELKEGKDLQRDLRNDIQICRRYLQERRQESKGSDIEDC